MSKIKVALRVRPICCREKEENHAVVVGLEKKTAFITDIKVPERPSADSRQRLRQFDFDHVFWLNRSGTDAAGQDSVFDEMGPSLEKSILSGHNATVLCYGQSGTGKTHTMLGTKEDPGLIPKLCQSLWEKLKRNETRKSTFLFEVSFMEIYREKVRDLLTHSEKVLKLREHPQLGPHVQGLTRIRINEEWEFLNYLWEGERRRAIGTTGSNRRSSRSHAIWTLYLTSSMQSGCDVERTPTPSTSLVTRTNQVHLVDLAGSEKADLITTKNLLAEGKDINRSLVTLGNVISALAEKASYIPYRDSTLTFLLKDSLGGNSSTSIIITASPASSCYAQTLNSFRFAQRARLVENQPRISIFHPVNDCTNLYGSMSGTEFRKDISRLANLIRSAQNNGGVLSGFSSKHSWNRLIAAIENWNHNDRQALERQKEFLRESSGETSTTSVSSSKVNASTSISTMTSSFSSDAMVQAEIKDERERSPISSSSSASLSNVPTSKAVLGTEVFIPCSNTIKCLEWQQEEIKSLPKSPSSDSDSIDSYVSPPGSPTQSRMGEKIHGSLVYGLSGAETVQLTPVEVPSCLEDSPVVRERLPTLIAEKAVDNEFDQLSLGESHVNSEIHENYETSSSITSSSEPSGSGSDGHVEQTHSTPIPTVNRSGSRNSRERKNHALPQFGFNIPKASEFIKTRPILITPFESTDEFEEDFDEKLSSVGCEFGRYRAIHFNQVRPHSQIRRASVSLGDEVSEFSDSDEASKSLSSSSSYQSLVIKPKPLTNLTNKVKVVETGTFDFGALEEKLEETKIVKSVSPIECHRAYLSLDTEPEFTEPESTSVSNIKPPSPSIEKRVLDCTKNTKFRTHFVKELDQMENIGRQIQNLKQLTNRHHIVKPYLDKIIQLQTMDHRQSDPELDAEIEECSGWNVNIELARVQKSVVKLNKMLKLGANAVVAHHTNGSSTTRSNSNSESAGSTNSNISELNSISKMSPKSSTCSSNSSGSGISNKHELSSPVLRTQIPFHQQQQTQQPKRKLVVSPPTQPQQSWHLPFPMSSSYQQIPQSHPQSLPSFQFPQSASSLPYIHTLSGTGSQYMANPGIRTSASTFRNFHSQTQAAENRLSQRWEPILPKTSSYLHRMQEQAQVHCNGSINDCTSYNCSTTNRSECHFHPSYQSLPHTQQMPSSGGLLFQQHHQPTLFHHNICNGQPPLQPCASNFYPPAFNTDECRQSGAMGMQNSATGYMHNLNRASGFF